MVEKRELSKKQDELREEATKVGNEFMQAKLDWGTTEALKNQEIEFQKKKIEDLMAQVSQENMTFKEKLESMKSEHGQEVQDKVN